MPRTKAPRTKQEKKENKSSKTAEKNNILKSANLSELIDVEKQWKERRERLLTTRDAMICDIRNAFDFAIMMNGDASNFLLSFDSEDDGEEAHVDSPAVDCVSSSVISPGDDSTTAGFVTQSELSFATTASSRPRDPVPQTPAPRDAVPHGAALDLDRRAAPSARALRTSRREMMPPPATVARRRFCTPATNTVPDGSRYNQITPKAVPNAGMSVLRRPRGGEMAFAMSGSPLMVSSCNDGDEVCNVNLPLGDGRVLSILPAEIRPRDLPQMSDDTRDQLIQLRNNLNTILKNVSH